MNRYPTKEDRQRMYSSPIGMYSIYMHRGKQLNISEVFNGNKHVPHHIGVYLVDNNLFKYWNGEFLGLRTLMASDAYKYANLKDAIQNGFWVGLKKNYE